jgi:hypothetical protein
VGVGERVAGVAAKVAAEAPVKEAEAREKGARARVAEAREKGAGAHVEKDGAPAKAALGAADLRPVPDPERVRADLWQQGPTCGSRGRPVAVGADLWQ